MITSCLCLLIWKKYLTAEEDKRWYISSVLKTNIWQITNYYLFSHVIAFGEGVRSHALFAREIQDNTRRLWLLCYYAFKSPFPNKKTKQQLVYPEICNDYYKQGTLPSSIDGLRWFWLSCLDPVVCFLPTTFKFYGFPIVCLWMYLMKVILDTCRVHYIWYLLGCVQVNRL